MKNKIITIAFTLFALTACGRPEVPVDKLPSVSVLSNWKNADFTSFNLDSFSLGRQAPADSIIACDGTYSDTSDINGVAPGNALIAGTDSDGVIQFGNLKHVSAQNSLCETLSSKVYNYSVSEDNKTLEICNQAQGCKVLNLILYQ
jgi:hypothetical protein